MDKNRLRIIESISSIGASEWDACAGSYDPFVSHAHLQALEESGCVSDRTEFRVQHLVMEDTSGKALAVVPTYLKSHSEADIGADMAWARSTSASATALIIPNCRWRSRTVH